MSVERTDDMLHAGDARELALTARPRPTVIPDHFGDEGLTMAQKHHRREALRDVH